MKAAEFFTNVGITLHSVTLKGRRKSKDGWDHFSWLVILANVNGDTMKVPYKCGLAYQGVPFAYKNGKHDNWRKYTLEEIDKYNRMYERGECTYLRKPRPMPPTLENIATAVFSDTISVHGIVCWEDFAQEWCFNVDSIRERKIYKRSVKQYQQLRKLLGGSFAEFLKCEPE